MAFDYEIHTRKPVKFPIVKPGGFLSHFFFAQGRSGSGWRLDRWPTGGVVGDLQRPGAVPVVGLLWLFFVP